MKLYTEANLSYRIVLMRVDFNVPMKDGVITDSTRIDETLAGIRDIISKDGKLILLSHWGRPKGKRNPDMSLAPIAEYLATQLNLAQPIPLIDDMQKMLSVVNNMQAGDVVMVENLRFWAGEEKNNPSFAKKLAMHGEKNNVIYINDAFATAHRAHASTYALARVLPAYAGPLLAREVNMLQSVLQNPKRPLAAIVGGAKISSKITLLNNLVQNADIVVITGGMANMFIKHAGHKIGASLCESDAAADALVAEILETAKTHNTKLIIPQDAVVATEITDDAKTRLIDDFSQIEDDEMILDAGAQTLTAIKTALDEAQTIIMNGPLGVFEYKPFAQGSHDLCAYLAGRAKDGITVVAGGGDTVSAVKKSGYADDFTYLSTAGGAFLEWLEGRTLPGIDILNSR